LKIQASELQFSDPLNQRLPLSVFSPRFQEMRYMRKGILAICVLLICQMLSAQKPLDNASIIRLLKAGLSEDLIVSTVSGSPGYYDTSTDGLIALKRAGATDKVVAAIVLKNARLGGEKPKIFPPQKSEDPVSTPVPLAPAPVAPAIPPAVDSVGMYYKDKLGSWQEVNTEVVNFKSGGVLKHVASVGIVKGDLNGLIGGRKSHLDLNGPATFILYVPEGRSPGEYQLLRLHESKEGREFRSVTGGVVHVSGGAIRDTVDFTSKKLGPRVYQIVLPAEIGKGEYGFLPPMDAVSEKSMASSGKIYTFSFTQ
jgi:hypothetical protein